MRSAKSMVLYRPVLPKVSPVILRHDGGAVLVEQRISAGVITVIMGINEILDGQRRELFDGSLDLVVERRELAVHLDDAVGTYRDGNVSAWSMYRNKEMTCAYIKKPETADKLQLKLYSPISCPRILHNRLWRFPFKPPA
jgi:hypothetical protein